MHVNGGVILAQTTDAGPMPMQDIDVPVSVASNLPVFFIESPHLPLGGLLEVP